MVVWLLTTVDLLGPNGVCISTVGDEHDDDLKSGPHITSSLPKDARYQHEEHIIVVPTVHASLCMKYEYNVC